MHDFVLVFYSYVYLIPRWNLCWFKSPWRLQNHNPQQQRKLHEATYTSLKCDVNVKFIFIHHSW